MILPAVSRRRAPPPTAIPFTIPAPHGINSVDVGSAMPPTDCIGMFNLISGELGLQTRTGYRQFCANVNGIADNVVRTMIPFTGSAKNGSKNKLFAATSKGIYEVSTGTATLVYTFTTQSGDAGRGVSHVVVTSAGHFLLYADEENGLFQYTESTNTWAASAVTGITGGVTAVVFVTVWKHRVWLVEKDTTKAYYLDAGAITGAATSFDFAQKFKEGGTLVGLWSWTRDGGDGVDDHLVGISQGGDVVIYAGTDPSNSDTFGIVGVWQLGAVPAGRRIASDLGGELLLMSALGILPISKLVVGGGNFSGQYTTAKISNTFGQMMASYRTRPGWSIHIHPADKALFLPVPTPGMETRTSGIDVAYGTDSNIQLAMSLTTGGWAQYRNMPAASACVWDGDLYFGTNDGNICRCIGDADNVDLIDTSTYSAGVKWSLFTRFHSMGNARSKKVELIRPTILSGQAIPSCDKVARYDYNLAEPAAVSGTGTGGSSSWGSGLWGSALWGDGFSPSTQTAGGTGMGQKAFAIALRGEAISKTRIVEIDVAYQEGGFL